MFLKVHSDLRAEFGPARDQNQRPTCSAFAASDAHAGVRPGWDPLSVEWAYYHAVQRDGGKPDDGATMDSMLKGLEPWGPDWGIEGYAWLTESYLTPRLRRASILMKEL
jgi:hypothetical protein